MRSFMGSITRKALAAVAALALTAGAWTVHRSYARGVLSEALAHVRSEFQFAVGAPMTVAAPLFGPEAERGWGGSDWKPRFLYPEPAEDIEGAVFSVQHGEHSSTWVVTAMDFPGGHVQYVSIIDGLMLTRIDIQLKERSASETRVTVVYERTALQPAANEHVKQLGRGDEGIGKHWEAVLNEYLRAQKGPRS